MTDSNQSGGVDFKGKKINVNGNVVGRDNLESTTNNYYGTGPNGEPIHNSLPNQPYFFGRAAELARIADALDPEAQGWGVLISGPGGIGKTALSIRAAHLAPKETYPIKIFLSAKVTQLTPQGVEKLEDFMLPNYIALLTELARELGDENITWINPNQRANEVRRLLAEKRALLVIDNLETFDEKTERPRVFQFLKFLPRTCKAIVTSRRHIDTPAEIIRLDQLQRTDALDLIARVAKRSQYLAKTTEAERVELYEIARGNPLLIEWLAGQLGRQGSQCRTIAEACKLLENMPEDDNKPLEFIFGDLLDTFTQHETAVLAALTYFTQPALVKWLAEIAKVTSRQAETALEDLADRSVLVMGEQPTTYLLPPLTATFLRHARPEVIAEAGESLTDRTYALAQENGHREYERFHILEAEWAELAAAIPVFLQHDNNSLQRMCTALRYYLNFYGHWDERLELSLKAERKAIDANDMHSAGWRAYDAGRTYYLLGQPDFVMASAQRAAKHWINSSAREKAIAIRLQGLAHMLAAEYHTAIDAFQQVLKVHQIIEPESNDVAIVLNNLGEAERLSGDDRASERFHKEALRIAKAISYSEGEAFIVGDLAELELTRKNWQMAEDLARESLDLAKNIKRQDLIARDYRRMAQSLARQGRRTEGLVYAQQAVAIFTKLRSRDLTEAQEVLKECEEP